MVKLGYFLSSEEHTPQELLRGAQVAESVGFDRVWISDHFHPWNDEQGQSPFVWSTIGAIGAATKLHVTTAVTCPILRIHPAIIAQAAATSAVLLEGRFRLGVGTGEALNEHILGQHWPTPDVRLSMLEEAVEVMRQLWSGEMVEFYGEHYEVENARIYTRPDTPPEVLVSGFGPKSIEVAARIGDGYISVMPDQQLVEQYRGHGGKGVLQGGAKVCFAASEAEGVDTAHRLWSTQGLPGQMAQELPLPQLFEAGAKLVTKEMTAQAVPCGPDPEKHIAAIQQYVDAGFDEVYVGQMGPDQEGMLHFYEKEVLPHFA